MSTAGGEPIGFQESAVISYSYGDSRQKHT